MPILVSVDPRTALLRVIGEMILNPTPEQSPLVWESMFHWVCVWAGMDLPAEIEGTSSPTTPDLWRLPSQSGLIMTQSSLSYCVLSAFTCAVARVGWQYDIGVLESNIRTTSASNGIRQEMSSQVLLAGENLATRWSSDLVRRIVTVIVAYNPSVPALPLRVNRSLFKYALETTQEGQLETIFNPVNVSAAEHPIPPLPEVTPAVRRNRVIRHRGYPSLRNGQIFPADHRHFD